MTARTRLDRVRASLGIAALALQQIEDDLTLLALVLLAAAGITAL
ncbi:hypothetical protein [Streptomyces sp. NPDC020298]